MAASRTLASDQFFIKATEVAIDLILWALGDGPSSPPKAPADEIKDLSKNKTAFFEMPLVGHLGKKKKGPRTRLEIARSLDVNR